MTHTYNKTLNHCRDSARRIHIPLSVKWHKNGLCAV